MTTASPSEFTTEYFPLTETKATLSADDFATPYREEMAVGDGSERILFEDELTIPSHSMDYASPRPLFPQRREPARLNSINYLNVVTYVLHLFVSWGLGIWGLDGTIETRWQISMRYETLVTPALWTYMLSWYPILVLEGIFAAAQLLPHYRNRPIVQAGTGYFFFYTFVIQTAWTLFFSFRLFILSFLAVVGALLSLLSLLASQQQQQTVVRGPRQTIEYYLFRFPFFLHTGWMAVVTAHHFSLLFRYYQSPASLQIAVDVFCLGILLPTAIVFLAVPQWKDFVIPVVITWSYVRNYGMTVHACVSLHSFLLFRLALPFACTIRRRK